jgi:medium-chain acyl-[acyl-carrier-protein] hydrolase
MEGWIAHYPGRGSRMGEAAIQDMNELVKGLFTALQPHTDKPFAFFGHSLGGLAAFELACRLRNDGLPDPIALFVSACGAPDIPDPHPPIHSLPEAEFVKELGNFNGIPPEVLKYPEILKLSLPALRADVQITETYRYEPGEPLRSPIIAFGGLDDARVSRERIEGWAAHTALRFESQYLPGDHFFLHASKPEIIASIAAEFRAHAAT